MHGRVRSDGRRPGVAYQVLNNLNFVTLYYVDAPTFQILGNLKIVATGLAGQVLLSRKLSRGKWLALTLLTIGAAVSQLTSTSDHLFEGRALRLRVCLSLCVLKSATMGVFTEAFMKGNKAPPFIFRACSCATFSASWRIYAL